LSTVIISISSAEFSSRMTAMREWLNLHRCEPSRFTYDLSGEDEFSIRLDFNTGGEAEAFERCFNGKSEHRAAGRSAMWHFK